MLMSKATKPSYLHCARASTLHLNIPKKFGEVSPEHDYNFVFNRVNIDEDPDFLIKDKQIYVTVKREIHDCRHSTVYLGVVRGRFVVLKCCYDPDYYKDLDMEAQVYKRHLEELQGRFVPVCFGYYQAIDEESGPRSLLLLEYCGQSLTTIFEDMDVEEKVKILNLLGEFHTKSRLHPTDFSERNVVVREGRYRLIDFHDVKDHSCEWSKDIDWRVGEFWLTSKRSIPCSILGEIADEMRIWNDSPSPVVKIHGRYFPADEFPPQDVIDKLMPKRFLGVPQNWQWVDVYFRQVRKEMDEDPNFDVNEQLYKRPKLPY